MFIALHVVHRCNIGNLLLFVGSVFITLETDCVFGVFSSCLPNLCGIYGKASTNEQQIIYFVAVFSVT